MRPGGFLILTTPNLLAFLNRVLMVFGYMPLHYDLSFEYELEKRPFQRTSHLYGHISLYSTNTLRRHLESAGFQVASIDGLSSNYVARFKFLKIINSLVSWRPNLASEILIIARKPLSNS